MGILLFSMPERAWPLWSGRTRCAVIYSFFSRLLFENIIYRCVAIWYKVCANEKYSGLGGIPVNMLLKFNAEQIHDVIGVDKLFLGERRHSDWYLMKLASIDAETFRHITRVEWQQRACELVSVLAMRCHPIFASIFCDRVEENWQVRTHFNWNSSGFIRFRSDCGQFGWHSTFSFKRADIDISWFKNTSIYPLPFLCVYGEIRAKIVKVLGGGLISFFPSIRDKPQCSWHNGPLRVTWKKVAFSYACEHFHQHLVTLIFTSCSRSSFSFIRFTFAQCTFKQEIRNGNGQWTKRRRNPFCFAHCADNSSVWQFLFAFCFALFLSPLIAVYSYCCLKWDEDSLTRQ